MKRVFATLVALLLAGSAAWADETTPITKDQPGQALEGSSAKPQATMANEIEGKIKSMDRSGKNMTLVDGTKLTIPDSLKLERGALKKGAMVKATYEEKGGQKVATWIEVRPEEKKPKS